MNEKQAILFAQTDGFTFNELFLPNDLLGQGCPEPPLFLSARAYPSIEALKIGMKEWNVKRTRTTYDTEIWNIHGHR